jgi:hypothetical protein
MTELVFPEGHDSQRTANVVRRPDLTRALHNQADRDEPAAHSRRRTIGNKGTRHAPAGGFRSGTVIATNVNS